MSPRKLAKLRQEVQSMRQRLGAIKGRELEGIAKALGRRLDTQRGKEPTWVSDELPHRNAISIPRHGSRDLRKGTAGRILYEFDLDLDDFEEKYADEQERKE